MSVDYNDYDVSMRALRKKGIHESKVDFLPIETGSKGALVFRVKRTLGTISQWIEVPIMHAQRENNGLIGFIFPDGTMRTDAEITCTRFGTFNLPIVVAFWKPNVPLKDRNFVADGSQTRLQERPTILVP